MTNYFRIYLFSFFLLILFSSSCGLLESPCKDGQGSLSVQERQLAAFTAIESRGSFTVNLFQNANITEQKVVVVAQENIIDIIQTRIVGQSLVIDTRECYNTNEEVVITIQTPALSQIVLAGSGEIVLQDTVRQSDIEFILDGSGNIRTVPNFPIIASTNCTARLKGSGTMELDFESTNTVNASLDGSGMMILRGEARENKLNLSGLGQLKTFALPVLTSTVELIGSGIIELTATESDSTLSTSRATVNARVSGSGTVRVRGNAAIQWNVSGSGKIERVN